MIQFGQPIQDSYKWNDSWPRWKNVCAAYVMTGDYDPMYKAFNAVRDQMDEVDFYNLMLSYILFYNTATACSMAWQSKGDERVIWGVMREMYQNAARGSSRRYFRGESGLKALAFYEEQCGTAQGFFKMYYRKTYSELLKAMSDVPQFGEYYIWKMMDIYDRVLGWPVAVDGSCIKNLPKSPRKGAKLVAEETGVEDNFEAIVDMMVKECQSAGMMALPNNDRLVGIPEIETFLCGISHHYVDRDYLGKDLDKAREPLLAPELKHNEFAQMLLNHIPPSIPKDWFQEPGSQQSSNLFQFMT